MFVGGVLALLNSRTQEVAGPWISFSSSLLLFLSSWLLSLLLLLLSSLLLLLSSLLLLQQSCCWFRSGHPRETALPWLAECKLACHL